MEERVEKAFSSFVAVVHELREKCPWDQKQTEKSLRHLTIEEVYELSEAILEEDWDGIQEELGDLFLHLVFYARIAEEKGYFTLAEVLEKARKKLIERHPHVYGTLKLHSAEAVIQNWERIKARKKGILSGVPTHLPALLQAYRMQEKVGKLGFDWENAEQVKQKVLEEWQEFEKAQSQEEKEAEFGDLLFALVNYARHLGINPEDALAHTNQKFKKRFERMEALAKAQQMALSQMTLEQMDQLWEIAKQEEQQ